MKTQVALGKGLISVELAGSSVLALALFHLTYFYYIFNMKCEVFKSHKSQAKPFFFYYLFHMKSAMWAKKAPQMMQCWRSRMIF